jgi:hypothetical protein
MIFKDIIAAAGVIATLPAFFSQLPLPPYMIFFLIFFFGTIVSGQQAMTAMCMPLAFAAVPNAGMPLLVFLQSAGYIAMQISPTHICLAIVAEYFKISLAQLVKITLPIVVWFSIIVISYYLLLISLIP